MNTNPAGNTLIKNAEENAENGQFERFEALMTGLVQAEKQTADAQAAAGGR